MADQAGNISGRDAVRVTKTTLGDIQEVNLEDQTGTQEGTSSNPLVVDPQPSASQYDSVAIGPNSTTGAPWYEFRNTATFAKQAIKATPGTLYSLGATNSSGATAWVAVFDATTANTTPGTTQMVAELEVANGATVTLPLPPEGVAFANAITVFSATTENGTTGSAAGVVIMATYD